METCAKSFDVVRRIYPLQAPISPLPRVATLVALLRPLHHIAVASALCDAASAARHSSSWIDLCYNAAGIRFRPPRSALHRRFVPSPNAAGDVARAVFRALKTRSGSAQAARETPESIEVTLAARLFGRNLTRAAQCAERKNSSSVQAMPKLERSRIIRLLSHCLAKTSLPLKAAHGTIDEPDVEVASPCKSRARRLLIRRLPRHRLLLHDFINLGKKKKKKNKELLELAPIGAIDRRSRILLRSVVLTLRRCSTTTE